MHNFFSLSALTILAAGCAAKDAPVEPAAEAEVEAAAPAVEAEAAAPESTTTPIAEVKWAPFNPEEPEGIQLSLVQGNPKDGAFTALVKLPMGHGSPIHSHPANFSGVALTGTVQNGRTAEDNVAMKAGTVWTQPAEEIHFTGCTEDAECIMVAHMEGAMGMTPAEAPVEGDMGMLVTSADDMAFEPVNPEKPEGVQMFVVSGDKAAGAFRAVVKFPAGAATPEHTHSSTYSGVVLSGAISHGGEETLDAGSYWTEIGGQAHQTNCVSEEPCVFFASMDGAFDMTPTEAPAEDAAEDAAE